jgi:hypothetical protein
MKAMETRLKTWLYVCTLLALSGCAGPGMPASRAESLPHSGLPDLGAAPELSGDSWLNSPAPLRLAGLRGKVVLVDMWTFG